jgi:peptidyl-prolyl cis-trans isomerase SurA
MKILIKFILSVFFLGLALCPIMAQDGALIDKIVSRVDDYIILKSELEQTYQQMLAEGQLKGVDEKSAKCQLLAMLIRDKVLLAKAEIDSVIVEDKEVDSQLDRRMAILIAEMSGDTQKIEKLYGKTIEELKEEMRQQIKDQLTTQRMHETITEKVPKPTPKEVKKFFNDIPRDSLPYFNSEVVLAHIVKVPEPNKSQKAVVKSKLEKIREKVLAGESFEELARKYSEDPGSAKEGGNTNWQQRGNFVPEYEAAAFRMKPGEISKIVESQFGFHLIKLIERRGNEYLSSHILMRPGADKTDINEATHFLDSLRIIIQLDSMSFAQAAKDFSNDKMSANAGGMMSDGGISLDDLDPYLYFVVDTMKLGSISQPLSYRTDDGKDAMRIIYYKSKTQPHQANLTDDYQKFYNFTYNAKKTQILTEWFLKAKDEVFIDIDTDYDKCNILDRQ